MRFIYKSIFESFPNLLKWVEFPFFLIWRSLVSSTKCDTKLSPLIKIQTDGSVYLVDGIFHHIHSH